MGEIFHITSLPEKGATSLAHLKTQVRIPCWKQLGCNRVLCPAYHRWDIPCWRLSNTLGNEHCKSDYTYKFERCLVCSVFKLNAETDPRGWNHFVLDQVTCLIQDVLKGASQKEKDLLQILDNLPDGLFTMDKEGRINYFNSAAERITGISASDAIGMHCKEIFKTTTCQIGCTNKNATPIEKNVYNREFVVTTLDNRTLSITSSISVLKDYDGNVIGGVQVFKDISDRKQLEDDLRLSESKYRRIFEGSKDMIFITSKDGVINDLNQATVDLLGYQSKQELLLLSCVERIYDKPVHWKVFKTQIDRYGFVKDFEAGFKRKDGTPMHCLLSGNAVRNEDGEVIGYEAIVKDITARMDAILNLQKTHRELSLLNAVALVMNATQDLDEVLMTALKNVLEVLNLRSGGIFLINHEKSTFSLRVQRGLSEWTSGNVHHVLLHDQTLMIWLLKKNLTLEPKPNFPPFAASLKGLGINHSARLTCFLITAKEKASGVLGLDVPSSRNLTEQDFHLLGPSVTFWGGRSKTPG